MKLFVCVFLIAVSSIGAVEEKDTKQKRTVLLGSDVSSLSSADILTPNSVSSVDSLPLGQNVLGSYHTGSVLTGTGAAVGSEPSYISLGGDITSQFAGEVIDSGVTGGLSTYPLGSSELAGFIPANSIYTRGHTHDAGTTQNVRVRTITQQVPVPVPQPYPVHVTKQVAVPQPYPVHVNNPIPVPVQVKVPVEVPRPYIVKVPQQVPVPVQVRVPYDVPKPYPVTVTKTVPVPVEKTVYVKEPVRVEVPVPVPIEVPHAVPVQVPQPVHVPVPHPVHVPVPHPVLVHQPQTQVYGKVIQTGNVALPVIKSDVFGGQTTLKTSGLYNPTLSGNIYGKNYLYGDQINSLSAYPQYGNVYGGNIAIKDIVSSSPQLTYSGSVLSGTGSLNTGLGGLYSTSQLNGGLYGAQGAYGSSYSHGYPGATSYSYTKHFSSGDNNGLAQTLGGLHGVASYGNEWIKNF